MPIFQSGQLNTTALSVPDLYIQIVSPQIYLLNGVPTNIVGLVGTAQWGPKNAPTNVGNLAQYSQLFGTIQNRAYDMGTHIAVAVQQGSAAVYKCVRVTDGTDTAATVIIQSTCLTLTGKYTGTYGNSIKATISSGSAVGTFKVVITAPNLSAPEIFDNLSFGLTGNAIWVAIAAAINNGCVPNLTPSNTVVASAGVGVTAPTVPTTYTLASGTDGTTSVVTTTMIGVDTYPRTGMYALRSQGVSVAALCDLTDTASFTTQVSFGLAEGIYMIGVMAAGDTPTASATAKSTAGIDSYAFKWLLGDWVMFNDTINGLQRLVSPQAFIVGLLGNLSPNQSGLNKPLQGVIGTQKSLANSVYTSADLQQLSAAGIDVITNPIPAGAVFGCRMGRNSSSNAVIHGDNYTRMTNYLAATLNAGMGIYVGQLQSPMVRLNAKTTNDSFMANLADQKLIGNAQGTTPWLTILDNTNNIQTRVALGYMQADVKVQYLSVIEYFIVNLEGGQSVTIQRTGVTAANNQF